MGKSDKLVGVIGGMGPDATVDFMSLVLAATPASGDQDHVHMIVEQNPRIPCRQLALRGEGESPGPAIASMAARLEAAGADFLVMPCNTAHAWQVEIVAAISIPFISIVDESVTAAMSQCGEGDGIGLMASSGDQDHVHMIVEQNPRIPCRQLALRGEGESPGPAIASMAARLEAAGADFLVMPCNTAHAWQVEIVAAISIPFISIVDESVTAAMSQCGEGDGIGLMATPGCFSTGLYQDAIRANNRSVIEQTPDELAETMNLIDRIKGGDKSADVSDALRSLAQSLLVRGAKVLIAACTELPLVLDASMFDVGFVSSTHVLATRTVALARGDVPLNQ